MSFKPLKINVIQEIQHHECNGKCTGKNGNDGYCYHENIMSSFIRDGIFMIDVSTPYDSYETIHMA